MATLQHVKGQDYSTEKYKSAVISEDFVKDFVKYPKTVKFSIGGTAVHKVTSYKKCTVVNKFTAKNSYGVNIEYVYKVWFEYKTGDWTEKQSWRLLGIRIEEMSTGKVIVDQ